MRLATLALLLAATACAQSGTLVVKGLDPVELGRGREVAGKQEHSVFRGGYLYRFASAETMATFEADPGAHEVQLGGHCARMGPLSGKGSPERWSVHDGRIYLFASDGCRAGFMKDPAAHLEPDDPPASGDENSAREATKLIELALAGFGGGARLDALNSLETTAIRMLETGSGEMRHEARALYAFPDRFRRLQKWGKAYTSIDVLTPSDAFGWHTTGEAAPLHVTGRRELARAVMRHPVVILRSRKRPDFRAHAGAVAKLGGRTIRMLTVSFAGATTRLGIDVENGRIRSVEHRGRGPSLTFGELVRVYTDFRAVRELVLPHRSETSFDGKPLASGAQEVTHVVDATVSEVLFKRPE